MGVMAINAVGTALAGSGAVTGRTGGDSKKAAGRFDTFTMSGIGAEKTDKAQKAPEERKAELIRGLSAMNREERALAAADSYYALKREFTGMAKALEEDVGYYNGLRAELSFCEEAKANGGKAAVGGEYSFGRIAGGQELKEDFLDSQIARLRKGIELTVKRWDRNAGGGAKSLSAAIEGSEERRLKQHAEIFNAVTGGSFGTGNYEESGCFDRYIDGINEENFVSKASERISEYKSYNESLQKAFNDYLDRDKTAQAVFGRYPAILEMRRQFSELYSKFQEMNRELNNNLGISDFLSGAGIDEDK